MESATGKPDPMSVTCTYCRALAGNPCRDWAGGKARRTHIKRIRAAEAAAANPSLREQDAARRAERVSVNRSALESFIDEAGATRLQRDQEFVCGRAEQADSDREFAALVEALGIMPIPTEEA